MELKLPTEAQLAEAYQRDLTVSFPHAEVKPLSSILQWTRCGIYRPWCFYDGDEILGEAFLWSVRVGYALLDYLCVTSARRSAGLGSMLIQRLMETEKDVVLFAESEIPAYASDPAQAERRLAFYRRTGARRAKYESCVFGVPYHTLYWSEQEKPDLLAVHAATYHSVLSEPEYERHIRLPWDPSADAVTSPRHGAYTPVR